MSERSTRPVRLALFQQASLRADQAFNVAGLFEFMDRHGPDADFLMPTELASTPYFPVVRDHGLKDYAHSLDGALVTKAQAKCREYNCTLILPIYLDKGDGHFANVALVIGPDGEIIQGKCADGRSYDYFTKVHLPFAWFNDRGLDEPHYFDIGTGFPVFDTPKGKIGIMICYDRRFPEAWRSLVLAGAELIFMPSCVPAWNPGAISGTGDMFVTELRTRAMESVAYVAACNRAGVQNFRDVESLFVGKSCIIDPAGGVLDQAPALTESALVVDIDLEVVTQTRKRLTVLENRLPETYASGIVSPKEDLS